MFVKMFEKLFTPIYLILWIGISLYFAQFHEPFADEAQSYLIARDASLQDLIAFVARTEGSPILWFLWLKVLLIAGITYQYIYIASIIPAFLGVCLFVYKAPFSKVVRYLFPLTYFVFYQYNIIARSYSLLFLFTTISALIYPYRQKHSFYYVISLMFLASISVHSFIFASGLFVLLGYEEWKNKSIKWEADILYIIFALLNIAMLCPELSNQYIRNYDVDKGIFYASNIARLMSIGLVNCYKISEQTVIPMEIGIIYFLFANYVLYRANKKYYLILMLPILLVMAVIPIRFWHVGILIFIAMWILWHTPVQGKIKKTVQILVSIFICVQISWSVVALDKDKDKAYSGGKEMYTFIKEHNIAPQDIINISFNGLSLYPYLDMPEFSYWDWRRNTFTKQVTLEEVLNHKACIMTEEFYKLVYKKQFEEIGNYKKAFFYGGQFFALEEDSISESFYLYYKED